jgi:hypothetical protein
MGFLGTGARHQSLYASSHESTQGLRVGQSSQRVGPMSSRKRGSRPPRSGQIMTWIGTGPVWQDRVVGMNDARLALSGSALGQACLRSAKPNCVLSPRGTHLPVLIATGVLLEPLAENEEHECPPEGGEKRLIPERVPPRVTMCPYVDCRDDYPEDECGESYGDKSAAPARRPKRFRHASSM